MDDFGTFEHKAGQNEVEFVQDNGAYVHVHHEPYGAYKHVIITGLETDEGREIDRQWRGGAKLRIHWKDGEQKEKPDRHTVAKIHSHVFE